MDGFKLINGESEIAAIKDSHNNISITIRYDDGELNSVSAIVLNNQSIQHFINSLLILNQNE